MQHLTKTLLQCCEKRTVQDVSHDNSPYTAMEWFPAPELSCDPCHPLHQ